MPDEGKLLGTLKMFAMVKQVRLEHFKMLAGLGWVAREAGLRRRVNPGESQFFNHLRVESVEGERSLQADGRSLMIQRVGLCVDLAGQEERCLLLRKPVAERFEQAAHLRGLLAQVSASRDKGEVGGKVEGGAESWPGKGPHLVGRGRSENDCTG